MKPVPVCIITLPDEAWNFNALKAMIDNMAWLNVRRIDGVYGRAIPDAACLKMTRDPNSLNNKGALGCFLGHVRAWEAIATEDAPFGIVLEDDVNCTGLAQFDGASLPSDFDLIFCNDRTALGPAANEDETEFRFHDIAESLPLIERRGKSVGGDGYILSREASATLLRLVRNDRYFSHVDLRLLAYCLTPETLDRQDSTGPVMSDLREISRIMGHHTRLRGYSTDPAPVRHLTMESRRVREDRIGKPGGPSITRTPG